MKSPFIYLGALLLLILSPFAVTNVAAQVAPPEEDDDDVEVVEFDVAESRSIAIPQFPTPQSVDTPAGDTGTLGRKVAQVISSDLRSSGIFEPRGPRGIRAIGMTEVTAPQFPGWGGYDQLVHGFIRSSDGGKITVGCYLYDVRQQIEVTRNGFVVEPKDWRRAAHKCADSIYSRLSGESPFFDSRIAYIAETGPKGNRRKRLAIMDSDGANHRFITNGQATALTPRFSPDYKSIVYLSFLDGNPRIYVYDIGTGRQRLITQSTNPTFAPRWSPDGRSILYSMAISGNTDIYKVSASGGKPQRLTFAPGIDIGGSFSPDGKRIVFESDRSGSQQLYVMNANGGNASRISFGGGRYATPEWSPRGDLIAFTKISGNFRIGVMSPGGGGERLLTNSWQDEAPTWAPNGRIIQYFRTSRGRGKTGIWQVDLTGRNERHLPTPVDGSDPAWGPLLP
ncbi:Tol-Pal system beta propeller repeat protein TolB [hydrothermal vent metagenome]|uniref:Tol-Pal system beta propeller repeat protein TolB n=1 Tax=hydrothermal vent metagenome TaxID=652676 RepID=A0A3B0SSR9_9ZZZZ